MSEKMNSQYLRADLDLDQELELELEPDCEPETIKQELGYEVVSSSSRLKKKRSIKAELKAGRKRKSEVKSAFPMRKELGNGSYFELNDKSRSHGSVMVNNLNQNEYVNNSQ